MNNKDNKSIAVLYFGILKKEWRFIALFIAVFTIIVVLYSFIMPKEYRSTATLLPPSKDKGGGNLSSFLQSFAGGGGISIGGLSQSNDTKIFSEILKSRTLSEYIVDTLKLNKNKLIGIKDKGELVKLLRNSLTVEIERSGLLVVTASANTSYFSSSEDDNKIAALSASITNAAIEGLDYFVRNKNVSSSRKSREYIEKSIGEYKIKLDSVEKSLEHFQSENKILAIDEQTNAILNQAITIGTELTKAEIDLSFAKQEWGEYTPRVQAYENTVEMLRGLYLKIQEGGLIQNDAFSIPLNEIPKIARIYSNLIRDQKILEQVLLYLQTQLHQEAIQEERDVPVVETLDNAIVPEVRYSPNRKMMLILSLLMSFVFSIIFVFAKAYYKGELLIKKEI